MGSRLCCRLSRGEFKRGLREPGTIKVQRYPVGWQTPNPWRYNINTEASIDSVGRMVSVGIVVYDSAEVVVNWINGGMHFYFEIGLVLNDIKQLIQGLSFVFVHYVSREANRLADCLAKMVLSSEGDQYWMEDYSPSVSKLLRVDCPNRL
ncbi:hypothetical protein Dsin_001678 [Dipteronia sinensis]|uniref:RNase H type-1 domain-containing protein n=1 Tax=Dipteronia sinensis TaxID=43782 RepID=A0AAE0B5R0_9ROSI|nr:hypothetical protein Dsin_001678 [Dipteronia sinensis]